MNIALITGASSGIGQEFVRQIIQEKTVYGRLPWEEVWIIARRQNLLEELKTQLGDERIVCLALDITSKDSLDILKQRFQTHAVTIGLLINCAGSGKIGKFSRLSCEEISTMIQLNCTSLAELTAICLPHMIPMGQSSSTAHAPRIIQIASSAGFMPQPNFAVYAASKAFVISFSRALHKELKEFNITSTTVCPGPIQTEFFANAGYGSNAMPSGFKKWFISTAPRLVTRSLDAAGKGKSMYVHGLSQKAFQIASKILPHRFLIFLANTLTLK